MVRERLGIVALAAFVLVDALLVGLAFRHTSTPVAASGSDPVSAPTTAEPDPTTSPTARASAGPGRESEVLLAVTDDAQVVRASRGSCKDAVEPVLDVSAPDGRGLTTGAVEGLTQVVRVRADADGSITLIGLDDACTVATYTSDDGGATWSSQPGADGSWYPAASPRRSLVFSPDGPQSVPCRPQALSPVDDGVARLLCQDGRVRGTSNAGSSWVDLGRLDGAKDLAFETPGDGLAIAKQDDCASAAVMQTSDGGTSWTELGCVRGGAPKAVASSGDTVVAQAGDNLVISVDAGDTWRRVRG
ncbi:MAG: hypothetical protein HOQ22_18030 [Nocardioidaceae bacterium]|nr:hypothetical protein [Nocardioidaceae bacterium]NUS52926.1 hypothetical protein [Nocardioidaceae bacterium]